MLFKDTDLSTFLLEWSKKYEHYYALTTNELEALFAALKDTDRTYEIDDALLKEFVVNCVADKGLYNGGLTKSALDAIAKVRKVYYSDNGVGYAFKTMFIGCHFSLRQP